MAKVKYVNDEKKVRFEDLEIGSYFKWGNGTLFVKCHRHKDEAFDYWVNENGQEEMEYTYNAFSFAYDEFLFIYDDTLVEKVYPDSITIEVDEAGE